MATILQAPDRLTAAQRKVATTLYLAGPFEDDDGGPGPTRSWRDEVIDACSDLEVVVIDPRSQRWPQLSHGSAGRRGAFEWQCASAYDADVVAVWVPESRHAPTALLILGYLAAKRGNAARGSSVVVGGDGWDGLVQLFAQNHRLFPVGGDLQQFVRITHGALEQALRAKAR